MFLNIWMASLCSTVFRMTVYVKLSSTIPGRVHNGKGAILEMQGVEGRPWYQPTGDEVEVFRAAYDMRIPVLVIGPTGCGKTRFLEYMAAALGQCEPITVACHDDLTSADLVGRYLLKENSTTWLDGPLTRAVRAGAICYLDELVEARRDTTVVIHSLTDHRRELWVEKTGERLVAHPNFLLVASCNPRPSGMKSLKPSTQQRFVSIQLTYPTVEAEARVVAHESGLDMEGSERLACIAARARHLDEDSAVHPVSTRALVHAAQLMVRGLRARQACHAAIALTCTEDAGARRAISEVIDLVLPGER